MLGTLDPETGDPMPKKWMDPITENRRKCGATEVWEIHDFTEDAHPIHVHLGPIPGRGPKSKSRRNRSPAQQPTPWETGFKDTVIAYPDEITRMKAVRPAGLYVWHCHIVEHEDNEMMRPYCVGPIPKDAPIK